MDEAPDVSQPLRLEPAQTRSYVFFLSTKKGSRAECSSLILRCEFWRAVHSQSQRATDAFSDLLLELWPALPPHLCGLDVGGTLVIRLREHRHDGYQDLLDALDGRPALRRALVMVRVVAGRVEDRDTHFAVRVDCTRRPQKVPGQPTATAPIFFFSLSFSLQTGIT